ncbi:MAG: hypothetical protein LBQ48_01500, partial [Oscillospiraceae bacterium]|nr:hypothetical protein [Oscillospiraceae bacterium]
MTRLYIKMKRIAFFRAVRERLCRAPRAALAVIATALLCLSAIVIPGVNLFVGAEVATAVSRYALSGVTGNGTLPDGSGAYWFYDAGNFLDPAAPVLEQADVKAWPDLAHTAWGVKYTFYNSSAKRSIAATLNDDGAAYYGISFAYRAAEDCPHDLAWTLIAKAGSAAGTLRWRVMKISPDGDQAILPWQSKVYDSALAADEIIPVSAIRAELGTGDRVAVQAYFTGKSSAPGKFGIELGSPAIATVVRDDEGKTSYTPKTYFPAFRTDGTVGSAASPAYIPVSDRFVYEGVYYRSVAAESVRMEPYQIAPFTFIPTPSPTGEYRMAANYTTPENTADTGHQVSMRWFWSTTSQVIGGPQSMGYTPSAAFTPPEPKQTGEQLYPGFQARFIVPENGIATLTNTNVALASTESLRVLHKNAITGQVTVISQKTRFGDWTGGTTTTISAKARVQAGDEIIYQYARTAGSLAGLRDPVISI